MSETANDVRTYVLNGIEAGRFAIGARLPTERMLAETLSLTRAAVRNGLARLENEGRIRRSAGSGTYVLPARDGPDLTDPTRITSPAQVMEARIAIEPPMAALVAANGTAADFERFRECVDCSRDAKTLEAFELWDARFHAAIADATRNPLVAASYRLITSAREQGDWGAMKRRSLTAERRTAYQEDHERILTALRQRDAAVAEGEIRAHLVRVRTNLLGL